MSYSNGLLPDQSFGHQLQGNSKGEKGDQGIGFKLTDNGDFDIQNRRLVNVKEAVDNRDAINKHLLDVGLSNKPNLTDVLLVNGRNHMTGDLDLRGNNRIILPGGIDMDRKKILNLDTDNHDLTAINNIKAKSLILSETKLHLKTDAIGNLNMRNKFISNLHDSDSETDGTNLRSVKILLSGIHGDIGKLNTDIDLNNNKIINIKTPTEATDACNKSYVDSKSSSIDLTKPLTHDLDLGNHLITFLKEPLLDDQASTKGMLMLLLELV